MDEGCASKGGIAKKPLQFSIKEFRDELRGAGIDCGLPLLQEGDEFVAPKQNSRMAAVIRGLTQIMCDSDKTATPPPDASTFIGPEPLSGRRNAWFTYRYVRGKERTFYVAIYDQEPGASGKIERVSFQKMEMRNRASERANFTLRTMTCGQRILYSAEKKALQKLRSLISRAEYRTYMISGIVYLKGKSGVTYLIRKSRPTIAIRGSAILCTLCLHPIGYFARSWMGALPPTDEVVAHLLLLRGDEHFFWKRANHIPYFESNSGI